MVPDLVPDVYRRIIEIVTEVTSHPEEAADQLARQRSLANLALVSPIFREICEPRLYKDCLVSDSTTFLQGAESGPKSALLARLRTLRLIHLDSETQFSYWNLLRGDRTFLWACIGVNDRVTSQNHAKWHDRTTLGYQSSFGTTGLLRQLASEDVQPFPNLRRVTMSESGDQSWGMNEWDVPISQEYGFNRLPAYFLNLPNVEHYCQSTMVGPLSLNGDIHKLRNPPSIVTFHPAQALQVFYGYAPPIILGATNRYMFPREHRIFGTVPDIEILVTAGQLEHLLLPIVHMVQARERVSVLEDKADAPLAGVTALASVSILDTTIELYNYIRRFPLSDDNYPGGFETDISPLPASDLAPIQAALDARLGRWKGRVILKNDEECSPCSACGRSGYWADPTQRIKPDLVNILRVDH